MIAGIMLLIMWSYIGIEAATIPSDETKDPKKTIPLALFWGTVTATAVYVLALAGVMALIPLDQLASSTHPFADAANLVFGSWGASLVGIGALISIGGALNALCVFNRLDSSCGRKRRPLSESIGSVTRTRLISQRIINV